MRRLYKFRALGNDDDFRKVESIINDDKFWCSKLWDLNDPMEGVYMNSKFNPIRIREMFDDKNSYLICSFSGRKGFENPLLWGYYANGFKGVAIEIEVENNDKFIKKMKYLSPEKFFQDMGNAEEVITRKLSTWKGENEFRFFKKFNDPNNNKQKIGTITKIYFGTPYANLNNTQNVISNSQPLRSYLKYKDQIIELCKKKNIACNDLDVMDLITKKISIKKTEFEAHIIEK